MNRSSPTVSTRLPFVLRTLSPYERASRLVAWSTWAASIRRVPARPQCVARQFVAAPAPPRPMTGCSGALRRSRPRDLHESGGKSGAHHQPQQQARPVLEDERHWIVIKLTTLRSQPHAAEKQEENRRDGPKHLRMSVNASRKGILD